MKFGKVLKVSSEYMPSEMTDLFLRYKELKKKIKAIPTPQEAVGNDKSVSTDGSLTGSGNSGAAITTTLLSSEEQAFITTLNEDLARFNRFFIEKEEEAVIRLQALCDELAPAAAAAGVHIPVGLTVLTDTDDTGEEAPAVPANRQQQQQVEASARPSVQEPGGIQRQAETSGEHPHRHHLSGSGGSGSPQMVALQEVKSRLVQFHGEMVLLLHWSLLNYAAVVKILKKHDKRSGVLLRAPYLANVLQQPFSSTAIMSRLAKRAEELVVATTKVVPGAAADAALAAVTAAKAAVQPVAALGHEVAGVSAAPGGAAAVEVAGGCNASAPAGPVAAAHGGAATAGAADGGTAVETREAASTSEAASKAAAPNAPGHTEPLVGSTMHALETWANLRKNAITPSTVLTAEAEQPQPQPAKRKAVGDAADGEEAAAAAPATKAAKTEK